MTRRLLAPAGWSRLLAGFLVAASAVAANAAEPPSLAVANFDFRDTSGEVKNQTAEHAARLKAFGVTLRDGLSQNGQVEVVALACEADRCSVRDPGLNTLSAQAETAGASYLLIGEIHKMSTLVGWVKFAVVDLRTNKPTCDRFLTYRGDTDEAWRRAAEFAARDVGKHCIPRQ